MADRKPFIVGWGGGGAYRGMFWDGDGWTDDPEQAALVTFWPYFDYTKLYTLEEAKAWQIAARL